MSINTMLGDLLVSKVSFQSKEIIIFVNIVFKTNFSFVSFQEL